ncbi:MAG TPA: PrgI family protein [Candidatus Paceibacterota bacterium]
MRFQVPQFIEVEDKIFGNYTIKQFIYLAGGVGLSFAIYRLIGSFVWSALPIIIIMSFSAALAFYRINERFPFIYIVEAAFKYFFSNKLYIWKKRENKKMPEENNTDQEIKKYASIMVPKISDSKLKDLTWSLDIKESMYTNKNQK